MNDAIKVMLNKYQCSSVNEYENALKEIIQEIALLGLWRSKFFEKAAFYGGSALRILYGLNRFSEDLDFSLLKKDEKFSLQTYCTAVENELKSFGFSVFVETKEKKIETNIDSAFIKAGTLKNMLIIDIPGALSNKIHSGKLMKIKLEVDKDPPGGFETEAKYLFQPIPFSVNTFTLHHLFAGKMHAVLCRSWKKRVKGRDWYDLAWYVGQDIALNVKHLENRMRQTEHLKADESLTEHRLKEKLKERIHDTDWNNARKDVENLVKDPASLSLWSSEFFNAICDKIKVI
ncbi:MAG: nucleotidyl transferase AbiEii/AbiGii toxin family protein [Candidatus Lokiarchaeota archaeon]|nr:nucleotidyl transferase AbiEii/AbiGii toxin family protein [Candidatus Lokiarchaeota archaeon]